MTTTSIAPTNGSNDHGPSTVHTTPHVSGGRTLLNMNQAGKGDGARKQAGSPVDASQRKPPPKAWSQGTNPITQRPSNPVTSNGVANNPRPTQVPLRSAESPSPMKHLNDRMMYLLSNLIGHLGEFTLKNGEKYTGVLSGTSLDPTEMRYVFKMVKRIQPSSESQANGSSDASDGYIGQGDDRVMTFNFQDVAHFHVPDVVFEKSQVRASNGVPSGFRTDSDISGRTGIRERDLQKWEPSADDTFNHSLEPTGRSTEWDQFAANEKLFGVKSSYDEDLYTTSIDRSDPKFAEKEARAARIARAIESSTTLNPHVREERGLTVADDNVDEESKYSGVRRDFPPLTAGGPNKYTPPARRPPTGQPTVPGAPVDPAIISSSIAHPGPATTKGVAREDSGIAPQPPAATEQQRPEPPSETKSAPLSKSELAEKPANEVAHGVTPDHGKGPITGTAKAPVKLPTKDAAASVDKATAVPSKAGGPSQQPSQSSTHSVEHELLDKFKEFSAREKLRAADLHRQKQRDSKAVKLNELKKFSQNFKLRTPVPTDLVPILAKDETKQQEIVKKALRAVEERKSASAQPATAPDVKNITGVSAVKPSPTPSAPSAGVDRQQIPRGRPGQPPYASTTMRSGSGVSPGSTQGPRSTGSLGPRLAQNQQQHRQQGAIPYHGTPYPIPPIPTQERAVPTGPSAPSSGIQTPTSAASGRFNARAAEFRPNVSANTFVPGGNASAGSSPRPGSASRPEAQRLPPSTKYFEGPKPTLGPLDFDDSFNYLNRAVAEAPKDKAREYAVNGGVPFSYKTPPTWDFPETNTERGYLSFFETTPAGTHLPGSASTLNQNPMPMQHQIPQHLHAPPSQAQTPHQTPRHPAAQPHPAHGGPAPFESNPMQFSHSTSSVHPSPRVVHPYMYGTQPRAMPGFPQQGHMPPYISPAVSHATLQQPYGNSPVPPMGGQMMAHQPSNGPYMGMPANPQVPMYTPPGPGFVHYPNQGPGPAAANSFSSPRPGAPMMHHQGSQQGHQPGIVYMPPAPMYGQMPPNPMMPMRQHPYPQTHQQQHYSPQTHHPFPQQNHRGTPSGTYAQPMMQQHSMPPQSVAPNGPANHGPVTHGPEGTDEGK